MKKSVILLCFCLLPAFLMAQEDSTATSSHENSSVVFDGSAYGLIFSWKKKQHFDPHWTGFGMSFNGFQDMEGADLNNGRCYAIVLNPIECYLRLYRNFIFVSGVGIDWSRYHFKGDIGLAEEESITRFEPAPEGIHYQSSKLLAYYATIPLLIEFQKKVERNKSYHISGGIVGYIKCYSKSQVQYRDTNEQVDLGRDLNILPVNARFMLQAGIGDVSLFAYYSPFSLIENGKGPDLKPMGMGFRLDF